jgi:Tannase and feruloyl esterase
MALVSRSLGGGAAVHSLGAQVMKSFSRAAILVFIGFAAVALSMPARAQSAGQTSGATAAGISPVQRCAELLNLKISGTNVQITKAEEVPSAPPNTVRAGFGPETVPVAIPGYCRADGAIDPRTGLDGKPYAIGFAIALPDNWNGRFLFQGGGGLNGSVGMPLGAQAAGDAPALARGFAVVSTDTGHKSTGFDAAFMQDQLASLDFAYVAIGRVTVLAKEIISQYYGQPAKHSYYDGCSTGGREGMTMSQRYPTYFDGIIAGDPAMRTGYSNVALAYAQSVFASIAPKDASGKPEPAKVFSESDKKLLGDAIMKNCDEKDGLKDGMIFNIEACGFNPATLTCKGAKTDACLSADQTGALAKAFAGPKDSHGNEVYSPFPYESGFLSGKGGAFGSFLPSAGPDILASVMPRGGMDIDAMVAGVRADENQMFTDTTWTNLSSFFGHGGKIAFYHGTADPVFSPFDTLAYYEKMAAANGGADQVMASSRFYFVPGMNHCGGGPAALDRFDMLAAVVDWVENGKAPDSVIATGKAFPGRSRPLCAYPKHAQYKGQGNPEDAGSFECRE